MAFKPALFSAPSLESCDTDVIFDLGTPSRKRKASYTDCSILGSKRSCDSPQDMYEAAGSGGSQTEQEWGSPIKDVDLTASDSLDLDFDDSTNSCPYSSCSSTQSEDWTFLVEGARQKQRAPLELSPLEHGPANISQSFTMTGDFIPRSLPPRSFVASLAYQYGFSPLVVSVGTTYFQRLAAADPVLKQAALGCADFAPFVAAIPELPDKVKKSVGAPLHQCQGPRQWLLAVHLTCIYIAAKNLEVVPYKHLLKTMLERLHGLLVKLEQAEKLELEVLIALNWRLGPFFLNREA